MQEGAIGALALVLHNLPALLEAKVQAAAQIILGTDAEAGGSLACRRRAARGGVPAMPGIEEEVRPQAVLGQARDEPREQRDWRAAQLCAQDDAERSGPAKLPVSGAPPLTGTLDITVPASLRLDAVLATDGIIALRAEGVTQSAPLSAAALALQGAGRFSLNHPDNSFGTVAGAVGSADLVTTGGLSIGSAGGMTGLTASGEVRLAAGGDVTQSAALSAAALALQGPGRFSLTHPDNSLGTVAGAVGSADLVTTGGLSIGSAGGFNGLASEADIRIRIGGELSLRAALSGRGSGDVLVLNAARLAALLASGVDPERAAALAARAAAEQAAMLQASSVPASAEEARATDIARGSSAGASADLATALARGASPAAAAAVAAIAEAERAAALEASTVAIADPQFAALVARTRFGRWTSPL